MGINFKSFCHVQSGAGKQAKNLSFKNTPEDKMANVPPTCRNPREMNQIIDNFRKIKAKSSIDTPITGHITITVPKTTDQINEKIKALVVKKFPETARYASLEHNSVIKYNLYGLTEREANKLGEDLSDIKAFPVLSSENELVTITIPRISKHVDANLNDFLYVKLPKTAICKLVTDNYDVKFKISELNEEQKTQLIEDFKNNIEELPVLIVERVPEEKTTNE